MKRKIKTRKSRLSDHRQLIEKYQRQVVSKIEKDNIDLDEAVKKFHIMNKSILIEWMRKYGIFDIDYKVDHTMTFSKETQEIKKLKELLKAKDEEISRLKHNIHLDKQREIMVKAIIEVVKEDYNIDLSKKVLPELLKNTSSKEESEE